MLLNAFGVGRKVANADPRTTPNFKQSSSSLWASTQVISVCRAVTGEILLLCQATKKYFLHEISRDLQWINIQIINIAFVADIKSLSRDPVIHDQDFT
ncbi:hypothetical protein Pla52n_60090 [Stieleria varia]|uniref:Uncharacterized protein n=1 Tax=Stieleria varia TaxID=2528005 RepID=A0A5C6A1A4_9BACT|nr:hypothetical protein Pla52n_60090 [Stieleria varia]